jgi:hypothetical protein
VLRVVALVALVMPTGTGCLMTQYIEHCIRPVGHSYKVVRADQAYVTDDRKLVLLVWERAKDDEQDIRSVVLLDLEEARAAKQRLLASQVSGQPDQPLIGSVKLSWRYLPPAEEFRARPNWRPVPVRVWRQGDRPQHVGPMVEGATELVAVERDTMSLNICYLRCGEPSAPMEVLWVLKEDYGRRPERWWLIPVKPVAVVTDVVLIPAYALLVIGYFVLASLS